MTNTFLSPEAVAALGLDAAPNAKISGKASFHGAVRISIGENSRIDDFCVLSAGAGGFKISAHVHVGAASLLIGQGRLEIGAFANISGRVSIYTSSDDYSGTAMTNPTVPVEFTNVDTRPVSIGRHVIIGAGAVILPGAEIGEGAVVGALSLVSGPVASWTIVAGVPARVVGERSKALLDKERAFLADSVTYASGEGPDVPTGGDVATTVTSVQETSDLALVVHPKVSVLMLAYNHGPFIDAAIQSVMSQEYEDGFEVVIGEDCSSDDTRTRALDWVRRAPEHVRVVTAEKNIGMNENFQRLAQMARGEFAAFCECDDLWIDRRKIAKQVALLDTDPHLSMVYSDYVRAIKLDGEWRWLKRVLAKSDAEPPSGDAFVALLDRNMAHLSALMCHTSVLREYVNSDLFDPTLSLADLPLILYCAAHGDVAYLPEATSVYRAAPMSATNKSAESSRRIVFDHARVVERFATRFPERAPGWRGVGPILRVMLANAAFSAGHRAGFREHALPGLKTRLKFLLMCVPSLHRRYVGRVAAAQRQHFRQASTPAGPLNHADRSPEAIRR